jgi:pyruvate formate lyase activating enzyme
MSKREMSRRDFLDLCARAGVLGLVPGAVGGQVLDGLGVATRTVGDVSTEPARYWVPLDKNVAKCKLCPRGCEIGHGERGFCGVRENRNGKYFTKVYGKPAQVRDDAMEKGPFFHYLPATRTLALGTAGCNLDCGYCQSWEFAQARPELTDNKNLPPESLVKQVKAAGGKSITFTYSEPLIAIEYVLDTAKLAHEQGIRVLVKTAGYTCENVMQDLCAATDAINIDLKAYSHDVYRRITTAEMDPMLQSIKIAAASDVWLELTNLVVPGYNDTNDMVKRMCQWIIANCGANTPLHLSRFFPKYKFRHIDPTPAETLRRLRKLAYDTGMKYVYLGNMGGDPAESTYCPKCWAKVIERVGYRVSNKALDLRTSTCTKCGYKIPGIWTYS